MIMTLYGVAPKPAPAFEVAEIAWVEAARLPELDLLPADYPLARALAAA